MVHVVELSLSKLSIHLHNGTNTLEMMDFGNCRCLSPVAESYHQNLQEAFLDSLKAEQPNRARVHRRVEAEYSTTDCGGGA